MGLGLDNNFFKLAGYTLMLETRCVDLKSSPL